MFKKTKGSAVISASSDSSSTSKEVASSETSNSDPNLKDISGSASGAMGPNWRKDVGPILLLNFLYVLQGIPLGLIASIPLILASRASNNYGAQAQFSLSGWPFSLKLLWAPLVDALFFKKIGRRKSWLVPTQYLIGAFLLILSYRVEAMLENGDILWLTITFFFLNFLAATQDVVVDGWALTLLKKENVGYASTCNSIGQTAGHFLGYTIFLALESPGFCNQYLRPASAQSDVGLITLAGFLFFWSWIYFATTTLVWLFKRETDEVNDGEESPGLIQTYKMLWKILQLPAVRWYLLFLLTCKIGLSPADNITNLKLVEAGVPKDRIALLSVPLTPLKIFLPILISRYTAGKKPMSLYMNAMPVRLMFDLIFAALVYVTPRYFMDPDGSYGYTYYGILLSIFAAHTVASYCMFVASMAFHARISDPLIGGTYMTLMNTLSNLGTVWPGTLVLALVDPLSTKYCGADSTNSCSSKELQDACSTFLSSSCITSIDGYYILSIVCFVIGMVYVYAWGKPVIKKLQAGPEVQWRAIYTTKDT